jgi:hypothetical protein
MRRLKALFSTEEVMRKGVYTDLMYQKTTSREKAKASPEIDNWREQKDEERRRILLILSVEHCIEKTLSFGSGLTI